MVVARTLALILIALAVTILPVRAERPIVDLHRLDAYFALFASDSNVPWKPTTVRLDTYSSAPVQFAVYQVDPADVLTAGSNARPRAISTRGRRPVVSFAFTPPGGYQFQSNEVDVQLGSREGFFVVEARRGNVGEQVWINRSRVGLVSKETPDELVLYGTDLGTGRALSRMRVQFVVNRRFETTLTDAHGIVRWNRSPRPVFALAQWGNSYAFLSLLPQAPLPSTIVAVRTDTAVVHAGEALRVVGFARTRDGGVLRATHGEATVSLRLGARTVGEQRVPLDAAGAFSAAFVLPENAATGDYAVIAQANGGTGGATVRVDANAGGLSLQVSAACGETCAPNQDVPVTIHSSRGGQIVHVTVVRSPHVYVDYVDPKTPWATTTWLDQSVRTGEDGNATVLIPHPNDELASTYGVHVEASGASADTRIVVPTARAAVRLQLDREQQTLGTPVEFDVYANDVATGRPLAGAVATVQLVHGTSIAQQTVTLDAAGHARGSFSDPPLGTNLVFASVDDGGRAVDAAQVEIATQAATVSIEGGSPDVHVTLDRRWYRSGEPINVTAVASGSQGDALITLESAQNAQPTVVATSNGRATAQFRATDATGELRVGAAFVRDGAIEWGSVPLGMDAPGRPDEVALALDGANFAPGQAAKVAFRGVPDTAGTVVVRIARGTPSGSALFDSVPALLEVGVATTQTSAPAAVTWHPWVDSTGEHAQVLGFVRRTEPPRAIELAEAETQAISWSVTHAAAGPISVLMPAQSGRYTLSVLQIGDDVRRLLVGDDLVEHHRKTVHGVDRDAFTGRESRQRKVMPDELRSQFPLVRRVLQTHRIPIVEIEGQEADDVIATLARQAEEAGEQTLVVTGDLDLLQIVDERTTVLTTRRGITELGRYDVAAVRERFGLEPSQLPDYRGLKGDPSDNLPGIPGVGEKTAIKLLQAAGTLDALVDQPELAANPKLQKLIEEYGQQACL
ncbi:MAG TPA: 5'-3' exonuclease H3TH domain-containing protein, partial [Candidatus Baltobacteraceae bacterium]|nr:5'-3' exonuclease H3TH domain-containing protein [Candidatus Baltobacteraceae bacterium]